MSSTSAATPILIVGFHRSGTSAIARLFHHSGVHLGEKLLGAEPANPHGHFEDLTAIDMHDRFLGRSGHTWKSLDSGAALSDESVDELRTFIERRAIGDMPWGVKDPRLCLYLGEWLDAAPNARLVLVIRRPGSAVRSLHMRHSRRHVDARGIDPSDLDFWRTPDLGLLLWVHYHQRMLSAIDRHASNGGADPLVVDYDDRRAVSNLLSSANARWGMTLDADGADGLDPTLGTTPTAPIEVRSKELLASAEAIWSNLADRVTVT